MRCPKCGYTQWSSSESSCCVAAQKMVEAHPQADNSASLSLLCELHKLIMDSSLQRFYTSSDLYKRVNAVVAQQQA